MKQGELGMGWETIFERQDYHGNIGMEISETGRQGQRETQGGNSKGSECCDKITIKTLYYHI